MDFIDFSTIRHDLLFNSAFFGDRVITVLGVGGVGSYVVDHLAGLGVRRLSIIDPDIVEEVNPGNQRYGKVHVGQNKVEAMAALCNDKSGIEIDWQVGEADGTEPMGSIVFMCVNGLPLRRQIMRNIVQHNPHVQLVIEARMGTTWGQVFAVDPREPWQVDLWLNRTKGDGVDVGVTACGSKVSVGTVTSTLANISVSMFMHWWKRQSPQDPDEPEIIQILRETPVPHAVSIGLFPLFITQQMWKPPVVEELDVEDIEF